MDRNEAVLRELNLYPLWVRRDSPVAEQAAPVSVSPVAVPEAQPSAAEVAECVPEMRTEAESAEAAAPAGVDALDWSQLKQAVHDCTACRLRAGCTQTVFGVGDEKASWLFIGEGPGADEDARGEPFVGQAGKLLDNMLLALQLARGNEVYIANVVKCRPPGNRTPEADEIATCLPFLHRQIQLIRPRGIVALGKTAATALLGREATLASLRGTVHAYGGIPLVVTYHPAYLLRTPLDKAKAWEDLCLARQAFVSA